MAKVGWSAPGNQADPSLFQYDLGSRQLVPPGVKASRSGTQVSFPVGWKPPQDGARGFGVLHSPAGTPAPRHLINYTPATQEVHGPGMLAPVNHDNLSLVPASGAGNVGMGQSEQEFGGFKSSVGYGQSTQDPNADSTLDPSQFLAGFDPNADTSTDTTPVPSSVDAFNAAANPPSLSSVTGGQSTNQAPPEGMVRLPDGTVQPFNSSPDVTYPPGSTLTARGTTYELGPDNKWTISVKPPATPTATQQRTLQQGVNPTKVTDRASPLYGWDVWTDPRTYHDMGRNPTTGITVDLTLQGGPQSGGQGQAQGGMSGLPPELATAIQSAASQYGVPASALVGIWKKESGATFPNPYVNKQGYGGLFGTTNWNASTQAQADEAAKVLADGLSQSQGDLTGALSYYNTGKVNDPSGIAYGQQVQGMAGGAGPAVSASGSPAGAPPGSQNVIPDPYGTGLWWEDQSGTWHHSTDPNARLQKVTLSNGATGFYDPQTQQVTQVPGTTPAPQLVPFGNELFRYTPGAPTSRPAMGPSNYVAPSGSGFTAEANNQSLGDFPTQQAAEQAYNAALPTQLDVVAQMGIPWEGSQQQAQMKGLNSAMGGLLQSAEALTQQPKVGMGQSEANPLTNYLQYQTPQLPWWLDDLMAKRHTAASNSCKTLLANDPGFCQKNPNHPCCVSYVPSLVLTGGVPNGSPTGTLPSASTAPSPTSLPTPSGQGPIYSPSGSVLIPAASPTGSPPAEAAVPALMPSPSGSESAQATPDLTGLATSAAQVGLYIDPATGTLTLAPGMAMPGSVDTSQGYPYPQPVDVPAPIGWNVPLAIPSGTSPSNYAGMAQAGQNNYTGQYGTLGNTGLPSNPADLLTLLAPLGAAAAPFVGELGLPAVGDALGGAWGGLTDAASNAWGGLTGLYPAAAEDATSAISDVGSGWDGLSSDASNFLSGIGSDLGGFGGDVGAAAGDVGSAIGSDVGSLAGMLGGAVGGLGGWLGGGGTCPGASCPGGSCPGWAMPGCPGFEGGGGFDSGSTCPGGNCPGWAMPGCPGFQGGGSTCPGGGCPGGICPGSFYGFGQSEMSGTAPKWMGQDEWQSPVPHDRIHAIGNRFKGKWGREVHNGVDIVAAHGEPVRAPVSGEVVETPNLAKSYGQRVIIMDRHKHEHVLSHLDSLQVKVGDTVKAGDVVGTVGQTGEYATAPHVDYRIRSPQENHVDPSPVLGPWAKPRKRPVGVGQSEQVAPPVPPQAAKGTGSKFGEQSPIDGKPHLGTDVQAVEGTPVLSQVDGVVVGVDKKAMGGLRVTVRDKRGITRVYAHLLAATVKPGQHVRKGQPIGQVGQSGSGASGPNLHVEKHAPNGQPMNPAPEMGGMGQMPMSRNTVGMGQSDMMGPTRHGWERQPSAGPGMVGQVGVKPQPGFGLVPKPSMGLPPQQPPNGFGHAPSPDQTVAELLQAVLRIYGVNASSIQPPSATPPPGSFGVGQSESVGYGQSTGGVDLTQLLNLINATDPNVGNSLFNNANYGNIMDPASYAMQQAQLLESLLNQQQQYGLAQGTLTGQYNGAPTLQNTLDTAGLTGTLNGQQTLPAQLQQANIAAQQAGLTGMYNGSPTLANQQYEQGIFQNSLNSALSNPWLQQLSGMAPGYGQPGWAATGGNTQANWNGSFGMGGSGGSGGTSGGGTSGGGGGGSGTQGMLPYRTAINPQSGQSGAGAVGMGQSQTGYPTANTPIQSQGSAGGSGGNSGGTTSGGGSGLGYSGGFQPPSGTAQQFQNEDPFSLAAYMTQAMAPTQNNIYGTPQAQVLANLRQWMSSQGINQAAPITQMTAAANPRAYMGAQDIGSVFGLSPTEYANQQARQWSAAMPGGSGGIGWA